MEGDDDKVGIHGRFATLIGRRLLPVETGDKTRRWRAKGGKRKESRVK